MDSAIIYFEYVRAFLRVFRKLHWAFALPFGGFFIMKLLIKHGRVVDPVSGTVSIQDLYIENGKWSSWKRIFVKRLTR